MFMTLLNKNEIDSKLIKLNGWQYEKNTISKEFVMKDFNDVLYFVNKIGRAAEAMNHHPDIFMHSWNKLKILISTHDAGGITLKDFDLANKIEGLK